MAIKLTLTWKKFYIGAIMRMQQAVDAMNSSDTTKETERKRVLAEVYKLSAWLDRPFAEEVMP